MDTWFVRARNMTQRFWCRKFFSQWKRGSSENQSINHSLREKAFNQRSVKCDGMCFVASSYVTATSKGVLFSLEFSLLVSASLFSSALCRNSFAEIGDFVIFEWLAWLLIVFLSAWRSDINVWTNDACRLDRARRKKCRDHSDSEVVN